MFVVLSVGCSNYQGVSIAFEELGGEVGSQNGNSGTNYRSSVSVSGLGQNQIVGSILTVPGSKIPDTYSIPIITGYSQIAETTYASEATLEDVKDVRDMLDRFITLNAQLVGLETEKMILKTVMTQLDNNETRQKIEKHVRQLYALEQNSSTEILEALKEKDRKLTFEIDELDSNISNVKDQFDSAKQKNGLIITHWNHSYEKDSHQSVGSSLSASKKKNRDRGGYLVLAGLKSVSLWLGDDFADYVVNRRNKLTGSDSIMSDKGYIITFALMAKHRAYSESLDSTQALSVVLEGKIEELAKLVGKDYKTYLKEQSLKLSKVLGKVIHSENSGLLSTPTKKMYPFTFRNDEQYAEAVKKVYERSNGYLPIYAVRSNIANITKGVKAPIQSPNKCLNN